MSIGTQGSDPEAVTRAFVDAWNSQDVERVLQLFTEDAVVTTPSLPGVPDRFEGRDQLRGMVELYIPGFQATLTGLERRGDRVGFTATVRADAVRQMGLDALDEDNEVVVQGGKVRSFSIGFTPETQAQVQAAVQRGGGAPG